ncbi:microfibrillar-associated protein [Theileria orientalis]|uniref:Microfibrillar-associated protein n=1 Tax=Theileria orientalis TaxID=68886 RepID=A0A976MDG2_THEOR|nr:microfibrillar-associated protein [Theileria orientalis]
MSALELFKVLGDESNRPPSPPKHILKKRKPSQSERVKRYWPGKAPDYAAEQDSYSDESSHEDEPEVKVDSEPDRRLNRYKITQVEVAQNDSERIRRRKAQVETITVYQSDLNKDVGRSDESVLETRLFDKSSSANLDADASEKRLDRNTLRRLALEYRKKEEENLAKVGEALENEVEEEEEESESSDESEYNENEEDRDDTDALSKPIFVPKGSRTTESEKEQLRKEELLRKQNEKKRLQERKRDTKEMIIKKVQELEDEQEEAEEELIDDTDNLDEKEYELWKIRELKRILRDKEEREKFKKLEEEVKLRRNMTDEERALDNEKAEKVVVEKGKLRFLQKYYHRGAFFMDKLQDKSEPLYARDFNAPTADDLIDKSMLPKPMQVRRGLYGKHGQVKHTHLKDVDTTQFDAWAKSDKFKLAGTKQVFDRPSKKK